MSESESEELVNSRTALQHLSHSHLLELIEKPEPEPKPKNESEEEKEDDVDWRCHGCGELIQGEVEGEGGEEGSTTYCYCYCCTECKFYLHKTCAHLPLNLDHPLHPQHTLNLQVKPPYYGGHYCNICFETVRFAYHCFSCDFDVDIKCALFPEFISAEEFSKLQHSSHEHPLVFVPIFHSNHQVKDVNCAACEEPTTGPIYTCLDCNNSGGEFYLHKKCAELALEITHPSHRKHPMKLLTNPPVVHREGCCCYLCKYPNAYKGFIYHCSLCEFGIKVKHIFSSQSENIGTLHQHPFILLSRPMPFICDACGTDSDCLPYICATCNLAVHKECISLPLTIKILRHPHPLSHIYSLPTPNEEYWECNICHDEVNTEHGSYYCSHCNNYIVHVNCAREMLWSVVELGDKEALGWGLDPSGSSAVTAVQVTATEIKHVNHCHNLTLMDSEEKMIDDNYCDGCMVTISGSGPFYSCSDCDFFLHKSCATLPMKTRFWFHDTAYSFAGYQIFICSFCSFDTTGFAYQFEDYILCLRCCGIPDFFTHEGHEEHPIFYDHKYQGNCSGCGREWRGAHRCKKCDFSLHFECMSLPRTIQRHKNHMIDKHPLRLTYHDPNANDPTQHYCDICEEERDPTYWFYSCEFADCNFTAHPACTLGPYPFFNEGLLVRQRFHSHNLVSVKNVYYYPPCKECHKPCLDLAFECEEPNCNYIVHRDCNY